MNNFLSLDKKLEIWESKLKQDELLLLIHAIQKETTNLVEKKMEAINATIQTSITAALITEFNFSLEDADKVFKKSNEYIEEAEPIIKFYKEDYRMVVKKVENKIKERVKIFMLGGKSQIQTIALLKKEFANIPSQDLVLIYKQAEKEFNKRSEEIDEGKQESKNKAHTEEVKISHVNIPKEEKPISKKATDTQNKEIKSKFKVVKQEVVLQGEYGTYKKSEEGVQAGELKFVDVREVDKYVQAEKDKANEQLQAILDELDKQKEQAIKEHDEELTEFKLKTEEIKAVFAY